MSRKRKYPKTSGYFVYSHTIPTKEVYIGMSKQQPFERWKKSYYKTKSLYPYIEQYGWENIEHRVLIDGLTKQQAEQVEDWFIRKATADGFCINTNRSGGIARDYIKDYCKQWRSTIEGKIYNRVHNYNRNHPNKAIETPLEAKQKYLETGYIPTYIKNDDLI